MVRHFGVTFRKASEDLHVTRGNVIPKKKDGTYCWKSPKQAERYSSEQCLEKERRCLRNFDRNMEFFNSLSKEEFDSFISDCIEGNQDLFEVFDLNEIAQKSGLYVLVLDQYKQVYVGQSDDIAKRIKQHWSRKFFFDRFIFGPEDESKLSIDVFKAMDTTRIFVCTKKDPNALEKSLVSAIPRDYSLNRTEGGRQEFGLLGAIGHKLPGVSLPELE